MNISTNQSMFNGILEIPNKVKMSNNTSIGRNIQWSGNTKDNEPLKKDIRKGVHPFPMGEDLYIFGWGCADRTLKPLTLYQTILN